MKSTVTIALLAAAGFLAGCAANQPTAAAPSQAKAAAPANMASEEKSKLGTRIPVKPPESQPVKSIGNQEWQNAVSDKPQPMPAGK
jgi:PBP1b-binding outer membrane lipoprotein LpoB